MAGRNVPVVLVPRFTGYIGDGPYMSQPIPASAYSKVTIDFWHGALVGTAPVIGIQFQQANDLTHWIPCGGGPWFVPAGVSEMQYKADITLGWFQFGVILGGGNAGVTCWAQGFFEMRER